MAAGVMLEPDIEIEKRVPEQGGLPEESRDQKDEEGGRRNA
jgi:hypothetical protein